MCVRASFVCGLYAVYMANYASPLQVQCGEPDVEREVESKINDFCMHVEKRPSEVCQVRDTERSTLVG